VQEIREVRREGGVINELRDRMVGHESPELIKAFAARRDAAFDRAKKTGAKVEVRETRGIGRNDPCPCGSGSKFKKCCGRNLIPNDGRFP